VALVENDNTVKFAILVAPLENLLESVEKIAKGRKGFGVGWSTVLFLMRVHKQCTRVSGDGLLDHLVRLFPFPPETSIEYVEKRTPRPAHPAANPLESLLPALKS
jgi:hypothetical protein